MHACIHPEIGLSLLCFEICPLCFLAFPKFFAYYAHFMLPKYKLCILTIFADYGKIDQEKPLLALHQHACVVTLE